MSQSGIEKRGGKLRGKGRNTFQFEEAYDRAKPVNQSVDVWNAACLFLVEAVVDCRSMWKECHSGY